MIEKIDRMQTHRTAGQPAVNDKLDELIEASNRQDRAIAMICRNMPGGMEQHLRHVDADFYSMLALSEEEEAIADNEAADRG